MFPGAVSELSKRENDGGTGDNRGNRAAVGEKKTLCKGPTEASKIPDKSRDARLAMQRDCKHLQVAETEAISVPIYLPVSGKMPCTGKSYKL